MLTYKQSGWLFSIVLVSALSGCAWAPGGHINSIERSESIDARVMILPITPQLVMDYRQQEAAEMATSMTAELRNQLDTYEYRLGAGDILNIIVYDHPELTIPAGSERSAAEAGHRVLQDGTIFYPYVGYIDVGGKSLDEVRRVLTRRLSTYIADPQVDIGVAVFNSQRVYVSGAVESPGTLPINTVPMTLTDAISLSGGLTENANWRRVNLTRNGREQRVSLYDILNRGDQSQNLLLRHGDTIHVSTNSDQQVSVMGQVLVPGFITLGNESLMLSDALSRAGGINENTAEPSGIFIIRGNDLALSNANDHLATVYQLDITNASNLYLAAGFPLQARDVVYVTTAPLARWNRVISLLLPSVGLPGTAASSVDDVRSL
ncbi:polysaccharide export protein [Billgrantia aerodenitrificans]|uniref:Polysaccharide export protein Wza n=1 Tax=Billgrantia aerodenitrificans TaxID=2733483 RepID=A0ABS9AVI9_9GAMM|nr:polysaccharide export protein [Halomonas aerodenitrificans]MCE8025901.1 polysaccharide export protein Wza [Halomonas aerodenitrificans]